MSINRAEQNWPEETEPAAHSKGEQSMTVFNVADGSVEIDGRKYTAEEYQRLNEMVWKHLEQARAIIWQNGPRK